ncbi:M4 family metallopeptidase [Mesobacillus zeae]|uniref:Neutral metalloproteinase n=1 Tax=Mesobacillus zeae TaxID=1917180 RepID=A0A398AWI0_9BACI|nr:M4 family metallopeptidase [Mesobacillus zeae]RID81951.1 peptidase M4 family protein [Mesobacillus zeae]
MNKKFVIPMVLSTALFTSTFAAGTVGAVSQEDRVNHVSENHAQGWKQQNRPVFEKIKHITTKDTADAVKFIEQNESQLNIKNAGKSLKVKGQDKDDLGMTHVRLQQTKNGVPVEDAEMVVHYNKDGAVETVNGSYNNEIAESNMSTSPQLSAESALETAKKAVSAPEQMDYAPKTELVILPFENQHYLTYKVNLNFLGENPGNWFVFVDAKTGEVIDQYNGLMHTDQFKPATGSGIGVKGDHRTLHISHKNVAGSNEGSTFYLQDNSHENLEGISTYDFKNQWRSSTVQLPGELFAAKNASWKSDYERAGVDAHYNSEKVYHYYKDQHGRNSIDGNGMPIVSTVHYGEDYNNAFWNGYQMTYGDGDGEFFIPLSAGLDVAAHEMTHGVTTHSAGLKYRFESGALNEAFSDIFGALVDGDDWEMGEDIMAPDALASGRESLRSLSNPNKYPVGASYVRYGDGRGLYPKHMNEFYKLPLYLDNGGVHINSSIINHAAYLTGTQIGKEKLGKIYYRALTVYLTPDSNFSQARAALIQSAVDLFGENSTEVKATEDGLNGVGITQ